MAGHRCSREYEDHMGVGEDNARRTDQEATSSPQLSAMEEDLQECGSRATRTGAKYPGKAYEGDWRARQGRSKKARTRNQGGPQQKCWMEATCLFSRLEESSLVPAGFLTAQFMQQQKNVIYEAFI